MPRLILLGASSGVFFSSTFVLNEAMSAAGGHWVWSASLRYFFMIALLLVVLAFQGGGGLVRDALALYRERWAFWTVTGTIGFGSFYALVCYAADHSPGWVIAATWQSSIVMSLFVFMLLGKSFPRRVWGFSLVVFVGVCLVNLSHVEGFDLGALARGGLPVLVAAFLFPIGNQLVWEAKNGGHPRIARIHSPLLGNPFVKVLLMSMGSVPTWVMLIAVVRPPAPSGGQLLSTLLVALFSGVIATSIFLYARGHARNAGELAGVDATQASEVVFALLGGMLFLGTGLPSAGAVLGLALVVFGLLLFARSRQGVTVPVRTAAVDPSAP